MKKTFFYFIFLISSFSLHAQADLDSLWGVWNNEMVVDTSRAQALHNIAKFGYLYSQPDSAYYYAQILYDFASRKGLKKEMASALSIQGGSYYVRADFPKALEYYHQCISICEEINDKSGMAKTLNNIGVMYSNLGEFSKALEYHKRSLLIKEEISDKSGMAGAMNNIGLIYMNQGNYIRALDYFHQSLSIKEEFSDKRGIAQCLNNIGLIYMRQGDNSNALDYFNKCLNICDEISDYKGSAGSLSNIGLINYNLEEYSKALVYYTQSLKIREDISDRKGMASTYNNIGEVYFKKREFSIAMEYLQKSLTLHEEISDRRGLAGLLSNIGRIYNEQKDNTNAIYWCKKGLQMSEEINLLNEQKTACKCLYDAYKAIGDIERALSYHERISNLNDSLQAQETSKKLQQMEFARQILADSLLAEKEKLNVELAHAAEIRKKNRSRNIFIFSAILILIGAIALYRRIIFVRRAKKAIEIEKERSDNLLLNILPSEIAEELKDKGKADARSFDKVSILFTDFKEFTKISEQMNAEELVRKINTCFKKFDTICKKYGIEKIKTIGDSYMAAGGLPIPSDESIKNTVLAGLEMAECMLTLKREQVADHCTFEMRIGIHTGSVVAGIVGDTKFQYDLWGDTVNTASRMENAGEVGKVNISRATYELIKDDPDFSFTARGKIRIKGKGEVEMFFVQKVS